MGIKLILKRDKKFKRISNISSFLLLIFKYQLLKLIVIRLFLKTRNLYFTDFFHLKNLTFVENV